ncbi:MAG: hypothetical protein GEV04_19800 [Actinophytocola sp.]|nr:hypothetical protein [Actinophytocola sp.]
MAVRTATTPEVLATARDGLYYPGEARAMSRRRPDGTMLSWNLTPTVGGLGGVIPFVIDWRDTRHPSTDLPSVRLVSLVVLHPRVDEPTRALGALRLRDRQDIQIEDSDTEPPRGTAHATRPRADLLARQPPAALAGPERPLAPGQQGVGHTCRPRQGRAGGPPTPPECRHIPVCTATPCRR